MTERHVAKAAAEHAAGAGEALRHRRVVRKRRRALEAVDAPLHAFAMVEAVFSREKTKLRRALNKKRGAPRGGKSTRSVSMAAAAGVAAAEAVAQIANDECGPVEVEEGEGAQAPRTPLTGAGLEAFAAVTPSPCPSPPPVGPKTPVAEAAASAAAAAKAKFLRELPFVLEEQSGDVDRTGSTMDLVSDDANGPSLVGL